MNSFLLSLGCGLCFCLPPCGDEAKTGKESDFVLHAELREALEGGPLVIEATLLYQGAQERKVDQPSSGSNIGLDVPAGWEYVVNVRGVPHGPRRVVWTIRPGERRTTLLFLHHNYPNAPSGKATLQVRWVLNEADNQPLVSPAPATLTIDIPRATDERVRALCQRLEDKLARNTGTQDEQKKVIREVINYLLYTKHAGLAPVAWRLIETGSGGYPIDDFLQRVYDAAEQKGAVNRRLVKLASDPDYHRLGDIFWYWRREEVAVSPEEMAPLLRSENLWTKALTYATFGDRCGKEWIERLLRDFREAHEPVPAELFGRLVAGLDDEDFAAREKATGELRRYGERAKVQLREALQHAPSAEAKRRMELLLDAIPEEPPPIVPITVGLLRNPKNPPARALFRLLTEGRTDSWATNEAKAILAERGSR
jgi:hypothetical protein